MPTHHQNNNQPRHARRRGNKAYGNWKLGQNLSGYKDIRDGMGWRGNKKLHINEGEITWKELAHLPKPTINYRDKNTINHNLIWSEQMHKKSKKWSGYENLSASWWLTKNNQQPCFADGPSLQHLLCWECAGHFANGQE